MRRRKARIYLDVKELPEAINEIISYLSVEFSKNKLFERDDLVQDLYLEYLSDIQKHPDMANQQPGYWFIRLKWALLTKWRKRVTQINREWETKLSQGGEDPNPAVENYKSEPVDKNVKKHKKYKKYNF